MKRIRIILLVFSSMVILSCDKFLSEKPKTFLSPENYFTDEASVSNAVWGCYDKLMQASCFGNVVSEALEVPSFSI